ncbi:MAG: hypothetical protein U1F51_09330 [Burkholderiales bacterium]
MTSPVLLLLGLPESGTSALAEALTRAGAVAPGGAGDTAALSQMALAACGMRWDSMATVPTRFPVAPGLDAARAAIDAFLERAAADAPLLIAEPAATRIAGLWRERIEAAGRPLAAVLWLTHPGTLAAALARRRQFAPEKSLALWLEHVVEFERATRGLARTVVAEDAFLAEPGAGMKRIAQATRFPPAASAAKSTPPARAPGVPPPIGLGSGLDAALDAGYRKLASTVSGELKRTAEALAAAAREALQSAVAPWLAQEIEADRLRLTALADTAAAQAARADRVTRELAQAPRDARALAAEVDRLRAERAALDAAHAEALTEARNAGAVEAELARAAGERDLAQARQALATLDARRHGEIAALAEDLADARNELGKARALLESSPAAEAGLRADLAHSQRELADERLTIARLSEALEALRHEADDASRRFEAARAHLEHYAADVEESRAALSARDAIAARLTADVDALHRRAAGLEQARDAMARELDEAVAANARLRAERDRLRGERDAAIERSQAAHAAALGERDRRIAELSAEADREADAIAQAAVRVAGLEEDLDQRTAELAMARRKIEELAARLRTLERSSLVRAAVWLGGGEPPAEGRSTS